MLKLAILLTAVAVCYGREAAKFYLYTVASPVVPVLLTSTSTIPDVDTIILIHGHEGQYQDQFNGMIRKDIFDYASGAYNVISVDWQREAGGSYALASANVEAVARDLSRFITALLAANSAQELNKLHLVGFGLGAHVAGIASRNGRVGRITGLDPSGSRWGADSLRLRDDDAFYVEVIHTDGSGPLANGIGTDIGQVNFYANGGSNQPGCLSHSCSHERAYELFASSMRGNLQGNACGSMTQVNLNLCRGTPLSMGGTALTKTRTNRLYRVNTGRRYPF